MEKNRSEHAETDTPVGETGVEEADRIRRAKRYVRGLSPDEKSALFDQVLAEHLHDAD